MDDAPIVDLVIDSHTFNYLLTTITHLPSHRPSDRRYDTAADPMFSTTASVDPQEYAPGQ